MIAGNMLLLTGKRLKLGFGGDEHGADLSTNVFSWIKGGCDQTVLYYSLEIPLLLRYES